MAGGDVVVKVTAILSLAAICIECVHYGIDHAIIACISGIIGGIAGYHYRVYRGRRR